MVYSGNNSGTVVLLTDTRSIILVGDSTDNFFYSNARVLTSVWYNGICIIISHWKYKKVKSLWGFFKWARFEVCIASYDWEIEYAVVYQLLSLYTPSPISTYQNVHLLIFLFLNRTRHTTEVWIVQTSK